MWGLGVLAAALAGYLAGYAKKKGENRALKEDLNLLVKQVEAVTTTTKQIEAKISNEVWDRQKQWELKREVLFGAVAGISEIEDAMVSYDSFLQVEHRESKADDRTWLEKKTEELVRLGKATTSVDETKLLVGIVCGKETRGAFTNYRTITNEIVGRLIKGDIGAYKTLQADRLKRHIDVEVAVRKELGIIETK